MDNNGFPSQAQVDRIRVVYPIGTRVRLLKMDDVQAPPVGSLGTVTHVDSIGTLHINWDCGSTLGAVMVEDIVVKIVM